MLRAVVVMFLLIFTVPAYAQDPAPGADVIKQQWLKERFFGLAMQSLILAKNYSSTLMDNLSDREVGIIVENAYIVAEAMLEKLNAELLIATEEPE